MAYPGPRQALAPFWLISIPSTRPGGGAGHRVPTIAPCRSCRRSRAKPRPAGVRPAGQPVRHAARPAFRRSGGDPAPGGCCAPQRRYRSRSRWTGSAIRSRATFAVVDRGDQRRPGQEGRSFDSSLRRVPGSLDAAKLSSRLSSASGRGGAVGAGSDARSSAPVKRVGRYEEFILDSNLHALRVAGAHDAGSLFNFFLNGNAAARATVSRANATRLQRFTEKIDLVAEMYGGLPGEQLAARRRAQRSRARRAHRRT